MDIPDSTDVDESNDGKESNKIGKGFKLKFELIRILRFPIFDGNGSNNED